MPTYKYKCEACGVFDVRQNMSDAALTECPTCSSPCRRIISKGGPVIFKGPGFYCTDYPKPKRPGE